jgi:UPF0042 nucleotide-binding protein
VKNLHIVIVSGLSGAGKSYALHAFEDIGFFCIDNLPPPLMPVFLDLCARSTSDIVKIALGVDIRERGFLVDFLTEYDRVRQGGYRVELIFLEAKDEVLVRRFSETRRPHPLAKAGRVIEGIQLERQQVAELRMKADRVIDTSELTVHQLKELLTQYYKDRDDTRRLPISIVSFGYKYGIPYDVDLLFDMRFLPNPNFVPELKPLTGRDDAVSRYIFNMPETEQFLARLYDFLDYVLPRYEQEGRSYLTIGIGCTGGRHRSVAIADHLGRYVSSRGYEMTVRHRDLER